MPKDQELLGVTTVYGSSYELGVFHTDGDTISATFCELDQGNQKTFTFGTFKRVKQFNNGLALQQKDDSWIIIPPHLEDSGSFVDVKDDVQFKDKLIGRVIRLSPDRGEPLFVHFHHHSILGTEISPGVIITDNRKLYLSGSFSFDPTSPPFVDLTPMTQHLSDDEFKKKFENPENFAFSFDDTKDTMYIAFQFDDKIYRVIHNRRFKNQIPEVVEEKGHLINSIDTLLIQDGDQIKDLKYGNTMKLTTHDKILWAQRLDHDDSSRFLSDDVGGFHLVIPEGTNEEADIQDFRTILSAVASRPITLLSLDTVIRSLLTAETWLGIPGFCR